MAETVILVGLALILSGFVMVGSLYVAVGVLLARLQPQEKRWRAHLLAAIVIIVAVFKLYA